MPARHRRGLVTLLSVMSPGAAIAQMPAPPMGQMPAQACAAPVAATGEPAPWSQPIALRAAGDASHLAMARIGIGQSARLALLPTSQVRYASAPGKPGSSASYGGLVSLRIREPGTYRIALGSSVWLDVVSQGKPVSSSAHGRGPACTGIHKMVDFPLPAGEVTLQVSGNGEPQTTVLAVRLP